MNTLVKLLDLENISNLNVNIKSTSEHAYAKGWSMETVLKEVVGCKIWKTLAAFLYIEEVFINVKLELIHNDPYASGISSILI